MNNFRRRKKQHQQHYSHQGPPTTITASTTTTTTTTSSSVGPLNESAPVLTTSSLSPLVLVSGRKKSANNTPSSSKGSSSAIVVVGGDDIRQSSFTEIPVIDPKDTTGRHFIKDVTEIPTTSSSTIIATTTTTSINDGESTDKYGSSISKVVSLEQKGTDIATTTTTPSDTNVVTTPGLATTMTTTTPSSDTDKAIMDEGDYNRPGRPRLAMSGQQVAMDENRKKKILIRATSGAGLILVFSTCVYLGHVYVCGIVALSEFLLFRELVKVRYNAYYNTIVDTIPLFRTTQWMWFSIAIFYTYGDFLSEVIQSNPDLHYLVQYSQYLNTVAFGLYSATFVMTIATMQVGHVKFQLNQLCWTIVVLCLTVGQMKYIMHNIFNGLFWFTFPFLLVVVNDVMAYFSGITCGRKFIHRPFISFSPNKTWEGFIGGGIFTMIAAWYLSRFLAQFPWMTCPVNEFRLIPTALECEIHHVFRKAQSIVPHQVFEVFPHSLVRIIPGIVEICVVKPTFTTTTTTGTPEWVNHHPPFLTRCISGERSHSFHHFDFVLMDVYPIQIHALWLGFFASVVAPFGGFLASAIKRAYGVKDFDSLIPGHGGVTDRLDCQFLMALCTWVHYNSFVRLATVSVHKLVYLYNMLSPAEKQQFFEEVFPSSNGHNRQILKKFQEYALSGGGVT